MKNLIPFLVICCCACTHFQDQNAEQAAISKLIDDETHYAASGDSLQWASCWVNDENAQFTFTSIDGISQYSGWFSIVAAFHGAEPFDLKLQRDNYKYTIGKEMAFVRFDQQDNWGGVSDHHTKESRTLKKVGDNWKILSVNVVDVSSYERPSTAPFHAFVDKFPVDPKTSEPFKTGLGGMTAGITTITEPTDLTPFFAGLPHNMCPVPHWGYVLEGAARIKYLNGQEDTVRAGEVFYMPAPHTGIIDGHIKFIDFSPEKEMDQLLNHFYANNTEQTSE